MVKNRFPTLCPSCGQLLRAVRLGCAACGTAVEGGYDLPVLTRLSPEDQTFILTLVKSSGSLKDLARLYGVSYPTVRNRLDALIERVVRLEAEATQEKEG